MSERIVINTGPLIVLGKIAVFEIVKQLPFTFITPAQVESEILTGNQMGYPVSIPEWINVVRSRRPANRLALANLDAGEVAVIETALELNISYVCIDEIKGRRAAKASGLKVVGSLGLLGRAKAVGLIAELGPFVQKAQQAGAYYDSKLVDEFLASIDES